MRTFHRALLLICASLCGAAHAETHALIMAIGEYDLPGAATLLGVPQDVVSAKDIARKLGVRDANMIVLRDKQLTLHGMAQAFNDLEERVGQNDDVFIYYSGHGGRQRVRDPEERCAESLVTYDGYGFIDAEIEQRLKQLAGKANRLVMFIDACHSGGVTTRAPRKSPFKAKYFAKGDADACERPVNVLTRSLAMRSRSAGSGAQNYVYIAAARDNEVSLDEAGKGGLATQAWHECLAGKARDLDGSGAITADEVRVCAQGLIDERLKSIEGFTAHHISITGNSRAVMDFAAAPEPEKTAASPAETLKDILSQRDDRRTVTLGVPQPRLKIGRDSFEITLTSSHAGFLYLLMAGSDGKAFDILFPNKLDAKNEIEAGAVLRLPRAEWQITAAGHAGTSHVLAMVTDAPRDFSKLGLQATGPFSMLEASSAAAKRLQLATRERGTPSVDCADPAKLRNLQVARRCSNAFGAALVSVEEVP